MENILYHILSDKSAWVEYGGSHTFSFEESAREKSFNLIQLQVAVELHKVWYYCSNALWWNLNNGLTKIINGNDKIKLNFFNDNKV